MRLDVEIPVSNTEFTYITEGQNIPTNVVPLYYLDINHKDKIPSDFLSITKDYAIGNSTELMYQEVQGPSFLSSGDKFMITHVSKYNQEFNIRIPFFYKFVLGENIHESSIFISDHLDNRIDDQDFFVEKNGKITSIFLNKSDRILTVNYLENSKSIKRLIHYQEVFTEVGWEELILDANSIPEFKYLIDSTNVCKTGYSGPIYIKYKHDYSMIRPPIANIKDKWNISILSSEFLKNGFKYSIPEYYMQNAISKNQEKLISEKKCKIITKTLIQLPAIPSIDLIENTKIFIYDYYSNELTRAISLDKTLEKTEYKDSIYFELSKDFNTEGIIELFEEIKDTEIAFATFFIKEDYYELKQLNLNSMKLDTVGYYSIYIRPNISDMEVGVYFAKIGTLDNNPSDDTKWRQARGFLTIEDYEDFISKNNCFHVGYVKKETTLERDLINEYDIRIQGGDIANKKIACGISKDVVMKDLIDKKLIIPTNDVLIAYIDSVKFKKDLGYVDYDSDNNIIINNKLNSISNFIINTVERNMDISTKILFEINVINNNKGISIQPIKRVALYGIISAGTNHSIGLNKNGTLVGDGESSNNQYDFIDTWTGITSVSAGYYNTLALKSDKKVLSTGHTGQKFNVDGWVDIVAIQSKWYTAYGLKTDGTVVAVGANNYGEANISGWTNIKAIASGENFIVGLKDDGTVIAVGKNNLGQLDIGGWTDIIEISAGRKHVLGLKSDGTVVAVGDNSDYDIDCFGKNQLDVNDWTDIISISAGFTFSVGLKSDGTVISSGFYEYYIPAPNGEQKIKDLDINNWEDIVSIDSGWTHLLGLKADGTVLMSGDYYEQGPIGIQEWKLL